MRRRSLRTCVSLVLVCTLLGMLPLRAVMAMPAMAGGASHMAHMAAHAAMHGADQAAPADTDQGAAHPGQHDGCHCGVHCGLCGVCHSTLSGAVFSGIIVPTIAPTVPQPWRLIARYLSPDPYPPRA